jgi:hypothetical protein
MGPATAAALQQLLVDLAADPVGVLIAATDADIAGQRYAARLENLAAEARCRTASNSATPLPIISKIYLRTLFATQHLNLQQILGFAASYPRQSDTKT